MRQIRSNRRKGLLAAGVMTLLVVLGGCRQDMHNQPKEIPQRGSEFFADGRSVRPQVVHTVARGQLQQDEYFYTGLLNGKEQDMMPFPVTMTVLERGQERFNIYCTPCHSRVGNGDGMIVQRGYKPAGNFHDARRLAEPLSHYFYVMTHGYGAMPDYAAQLSPEDRWAVAAYIRALQLSQNARLSDVPQGEQVHDLGQIAEREGLPASFAGPWPIAQDTDAQALPAQGIVAGAPAENANSVNLTGKTEGNAQDSARSHAMQTTSSGPKQ
ncbi:c-type cytochrome [Pseudacidobacterium ailaaui]|uniref:c-type cytochrome n=1 Tax=Pseudacidobacterium ailaaui TaxID=1382359 RepID=UPI000AD362B9|nr:cytochrome c [Pseudacidobacterium ailaaui]